MSASRREALARLAASKGARYEEDEYEEEEDHTTGNSAVYGVEEEDLRGFIVDESGMEVDVDEDDDIEYDEYELPALGEYDVEKKKRKQRERKKKEIIPKRIANVFLGGSTRKGTGKDSSGNFSSSSVVVDPSSSRYRAVPIVSDLTDSADPSSVPISKGSSGSDSFLDSLLSSLEKTSSNMSFPPSATKRIISSESSVHTRRLATSDVQHLPSEVVAPSSFSQRDRPFLKTHVHQASSSIAGLAPHSSDNANNASFSTVSSDQHIFAASAKADHHLRDSASNTVEKDAKVNEVSDTGFSSFMDDICDDDILDESQFLDVQKETKPSVQIMREQLDSGWFKISVMSVDEPEANMSPQSSSFRDSSNRSEKLKDIPRNSDGSIDVFLMDAFEEPNGSGIVTLFGKVRLDSQSTSSSQSPAFASICISIRQVERSLFFLPRMSSDGSPLYSFDEVAAEIDSILPNQGIREYRMKSIQKRYAFELSFIPRKETSYIEVAYPSSNPILPSSYISGKTYAHVFGVSTSALETVLLSRKIKGPSWINIKDFYQPDAPISWSKYEITIDSPSSLSVCVNPPFEMPRVTVLSLALKTFLNEESGMNEVSIASCLFYPSVSIEGSTENIQQSIQSFTVVRKLSGRPYPMGFVESVRGGSRKIEPVSTERDLLNVLMGRIDHLDPDVIVGHNFLGFDLDVLLHRMRELNVGQWSKLGRLHRKVMPKLQIGAGGTRDSTWAEKLVLSGRLICDTYLSAREHLREKSYSLSELSRTQLGLDREEIDSSLPILSAYFDATNSLTHLCRHTENDAFLASCLMLKLAILPLTRQLTNIAGNLWSRTLTGSRAERIEFLLLHEFTSLGFIVPDKKLYQRKSVSAEEDDEFPEERRAVGGRKKPAYEGGLVLEPKRGLYDNYVVLLDFNSLYPSIIQEYNICFTTVKRPPRKEDGSYERAQEPDPNSLYESDDDDPVESESSTSKSDAPGKKSAKTDDSSVASGASSRAIPSNDSSINRHKNILPRLLKTLVEKRKQVKNLLKGERDRAIQEQLDVRQKALKLTANSIYGCLGFTNSRFFAQPLAELITRKGRETLQLTVELATTKIGVDVIYGDTDSIMVHTHSQDLQVALKMANDVRKEVNRLFHCLEIDIDGVFKTLLLLQKKKYAAIVLSDLQDIEGKTLKKEIKGLDMVRRDWCPLSQEISNSILEDILSCKSREDIVASIHQRLQELGEELRSPGMTIPLEKFVITKGLAKAPEDYPDARSLPHIQVAKKMREKNIPIHIGLRIPYVICENPEIPSFADRAFHPRDVLDSNGSLRVDVEWYLVQQIHPPVMRLCEHIEGTDSVLLAECLGIDSKLVISTTLDDGAYDDVEMYRTDKYFMHCDRLSITDSVGCFEFDGVYKSLSSLSDPDNRPRRILVNPAGESIPIPLIANQLTRAIRKHILLYYQGDVTPIDGSEEDTSRIDGKRKPTLSDFSTIPLLVRESYSSNDLDRQLKYFHYLFDVDGAMEKLEKLKSASSNRSNRVPPYPEDTDDLRRLATHVKRWLDRSSFEKVSTGSIFGRIWS